MSCAEWQEQVALYAGGDEAGPDVAAHVEGCQACAEYARDLRLAIAQWRVLPELPEEALREVRRRVHARLDRPRTMAWWLAAAAAVVLLALLIPKNLAFREDNLTVSLPAPPGAPKVTMSAAEPVRVVARVSRASRKKAPPASMIKILTDDPDVVILLVEFEGGF